MHDFKKFIAEEIKGQQRILKESRRRIAHAPAGTLRCRKRKTKNTFYLFTHGDGHSKEVNITSDLELVSRMVKKRLYTAAAGRASYNIKLLEHLLHSYKDSDPLIIADSLPPSYKAALQEEAMTAAQLWAADQSKQYFFDPKVHKHETISGIMVRSKSEALIANMLTYYGIPFYYEKPFDKTAPDGRKYFPDFTIILPTGEVILWEHFGLLDDLNYCIHNAEKLNFYQSHNYMIGINLLITQDDCNGGCSSMHIDKLIRESLLPYFK